MIYWAGTLVDNVTYFTGLQAVASIPSAVIRSSADRKLIKAIGKFEHERVIPNYDEKEQRMKKELVQYIVENVIHRHLVDFRSEIFYVGGSYECTNIQESSDFDIQLCLKMPTIYPWNIYSRVPCVEVISPGWGKIKGGPEHLLSEDGYLSTSKVRNKLMSEVDKFLSREDRLKFKREPVRISRSYHGPAVTLRVYWKQIILDIDLVPCVKSDEINNSNDADMVAKPEAGITRWRTSYSRREKDKCAYLNKYYSKAITLLKIFKVLRNRNGQLGQLPSFFYKHVLFTLADKYLTSWRRNCLPYRFKDMVNMIQKALQDCSFRNYFNRDQNILSEYSEHSLQNAAGFLARIIKKDEYYTLLE